MSAAPASASSPTADSLTGSAFTGVILGTAVGDALGLPAEGLSPATIQRRWPGPWRHRLLCGRGLLSDDTEHTLLVAQSLLEHPANAARFQRALAWRLRWWLLSLPAGVGFATARAIGKLWLGFPPNRSGVFSAGNGPAMRSAILGVYFAHDESLRRRYTRATTELTHTDPKALAGAQAVADLAAALTRREPLADADVVALLHAASSEPAWREWVDRLADARRRQLSVAAFAAEQGWARSGVSGYVLHTVPVAIYGWWCHRHDFRTALEAVLTCGGDTDTVGAITGALAGCEVGAEGIPAPWLEGIVEWPRSVRWMRRLAARLATPAALPSTPARAHSLGPLPLCWPALPVRNAAFLVIVLSHGFYRLVR